MQLKNNKIDLEVIKNKVNFYDLAIYFGESGLKTNYNSIFIRCPFHKTENGEAEKTPSFSYHVEKKFYYCFSCHVNGDIFSYVGHKLKLSKFKEIIDFLLKFLNIEKEKLNEYSKNLDYKKHLEILSIQELKPFRHYSEQDILNMVDFRSTLTLDSRFSKETLDEFQVGFDFREKRIVIPIRDIDSNLIGATGRTILKNYKEQGIKKWKHYQGSNISSTFFNIRNGIKYSKENNGSIIIVEGPKDVLWLHQNGFKNVVACLTNSISNKQKLILLNNFLTIYLFLDGDAGGQVGRSSIIEKINGYFNIYNIETLKGKDPDEMTKEEINDAIRSATKVG